MSAPTRITLTPELTEQLRELHTAQDVINRLEPAGEMLTALEEMVEAQEERCTEIIDQLMDLLDHLNPPHCTEGEEER